MDAEFAKRWVADLRDPANKQCAGMLYNGRGYCCLGRAAVLAGATLVPLRLEHWIRAGSVTIVERPDEFVIDGTQDEDGLQGEQEALTEEIAARIGMSALAGEPKNRGMVEIGDGSYDSLADANDSGCTFDQIADWIEVNYERL